MKDIKINPFKFAVIQHQHYSTMVKLGYEHKEAMEFTNQLIHNLCIMQVMLSSVPSKFDKN
ncbi:hypothetical protein [Halonatronum saccharophilum]|uniref:hypothetical protein n=1 Tax=Halonatronum saccharophilum TaxID=150060 RepID=UPI0004856E8B|nr:hypothetical protein [Halonatronum saccharophilum]